MMLVPSVDSLDLAFNRLPDPILHKVADGPPEFQAPQRVAAPSVIRTPLAMQRCPDEMGAAPERHPVFVVGRASSSQMT